MPSQHVESACAWSLHVTFPPTHPADEAGLTAVVTPFPGVCIVHQNKPGCLAMLWHIVVTHFPGMNAVDHSIQGSLATCRWFLTVHIAGQQATSTPNRSLVAAEPQWAGDVPDRLWPVQAGGPDRHQQWAGCPLGHPEPNCPSKGFRHARGCRQGLVP